MAWAALIGFLEDNKAALIPSSGLGAIEGSALPNQLLIIQHRQNSLAWENSDGESQGKGAIFQQRPFLVFPQKSIRRLSEDKHT